MELNAVKFLAVARDSRRRTVVRHSRDAESLRNAADVIRMAHERLHGRFYALEQHAVLRHAHFSRAVFGHGARRHLSSERRGHHLHAVTYAEDWYAQPEQRGIRLGRVLRIHAERTASEDDPYRGELRTSSAGVAPGRMTECTLRLLTVRAISSLYCPPKSSTNTV